MSQGTSSSLSTLHTTLAQDAFRLYYGVIDHVIDNVRRDLLESGKSEAEAKKIASKLEEKWKANLEQSGCIDQQNMMGLRKRLGLGSGMNDNNMNSQSDAMGMGGLGAMGGMGAMGSMGGLNGMGGMGMSGMGGMGGMGGMDGMDGMMMGSMDPLGGDMMGVPPSLSNSGSNGSNSRMVDLGPGFGNNQPYGGVHSQGPPRKRARLPKNNYNNLSGPSVIAPTYPSSNPHIEGMGVPSIDQVPNPFENAPVGGGSQGGQQNRQISGRYGKFAQRDGANDDILNDEDDTNDVNDVNDVNDAKDEMDEMDEMDVMNNIDNDDNIASVSKDANGVTTVVLKEAVRVNFKISQADGPAPMLTSSGVVGFSDDEDEDDNKNNQNNNNNNNKNSKQSDGKIKSKSEQQKGSKNGNNSNGNKNNNSNSNNNNNDDNNDNGNGLEPFMYNGRDLNAPLNSDDDDSCEEQDLEINDVIRCQYTKVSRKKKEWKVELKNGIMHIAHKDYAFQKAANGTFHWSI